MRKTTIVLLAVAMLTACAAEQGPGEAVQEFYEHLDEGEYSLAMEMYHAEALETIENPDVMGEGGFEAWALDETHDGTVREVEILSAEEQGDAADVRYRIVWEDGSSAERNVTLRREGGAWRIGLVG